MKIYLNSSEIQEVLKLSKADTVSFINEDGKTTIVAHDYDYKNMKFKNQLVKRVSGTRDDEKGVTKIDAKILKMLPKNSSVTITDDTITAGKRKIKYIKNDDVFYPEAIENYLTTIQGSELKGLLSVEYAIDKDEIKPSLSGICIKNNRFMALDGYRLAIRKGDFEANEEVVFHKDILPILKKIKTNEEIKIYYNNKYVRFNIGELDVIGSRIEEKYIDIDRVIPNYHTTKVDLKNTKELLDLLKDYKKNDLKVIILNFNNNSLTVSASNEIMSIKDNLDITDIEGDDLEIAFNVDYLVDAFKNYDDATLKMTSAVSAMIFESENKLDLVLPVRMPKEYCN